MYTITIVLSPDMTKCLVCNQQKQHAYNFVGGKVEELEPPMEASYRELQEETGITKDDIELFFVREEHVTLWDNSVWGLYITVGVLQHEVQLKEEKNPLTWIDTTDVKFLLGMYGDGNCLTFMLEALRRLEKEYSV